MLYGRLFSSEGITPLLPWLAVQKSTESLFAAAPSLVAEHTPYPWHINWFQSGSWCIGTWNRDESLVNFLNRCGRTLQFDPEIANLNSVANHSATNFWNQHKNNRRVMPSDTQVLPTLDSSPVIAAPQPQIMVRPQDEKPKVVFGHQTEKPKIILRNQD